MKFRHPKSWRLHRKAAFSLVEIALSLGIVGFALVGLMGAIPLAAGSSAQAIAQSRAANIADTIFANFRAQSFGAVQYIDAFGAGMTSATIDLNAKLTPSPNTAGAPVPPTYDINPVTFYAAFDETPATSASTDARRLHFLSQPPSGVAAYKIVLSFDNHPAGTLNPYAVTPEGKVRAQANAVEASISSLDRPKEVYRFNSLIANRS